MREEITIASADATRFAEFLRLRAELGMDDPAPALETWLATVAPETFFLERDGECVAYGWGQTLGGDAYVRHVVVDPAHRRRGLGRRVMSEHARRFRAAKCATWRLNVLKHNTAAIELYRALGFAREHSTWVLRLAPAQIAELPRAERSFGARDFTASDDARVEREFQLPVGLLARHRAHPNRRFVVVENMHGELTAFAHFDPAFPGCWPLRARDAGSARALLDALAPDIPAGAAWVQLVVERDEAVAKALQLAGARLKHEIEHFAGPLPHE